MKVTKVPEVKTSTRTVQQIAKQQSKLPDVQSIKSYAQYMRLYGLKN